VRHGLAIGHMRDQPWRHADAFDLAMGAEHGIDIDIGVRGIGHGIDRDLDARRAGIDDGDHRMGGMGGWAHGMASRLGSLTQGIHTAKAEAVSRRAWATSTAMAQLPIRARTLSARLVRMMGTRAPSTMPAASAPARNVSCLASMLPASRSGTSRMSG